MRYPILQRQWWKTIALACFVLLFSHSVLDAQERSKKKSAAQLADYIDQQIEKYWAKNNIKPSPLASDAEFLRRVHLDIGGRIPKVADARNFLESQEPKKREQILEKLLDSPHYVSHFTNTWENLMLPDRTDFRIAAYSRGFRTWLVDEVRQNTGYDKMVYEVLTSGVNQNKPGQPYRPSSNSAYAFYQANELKPENIASATTRIFLGVRLECAQCHDHPFADWSRDQFWGFAAFFSNVRPQFNRPNQPAVVPVKLGKINIPGTKRTVDAKFLDGSLAKFENNDDPRTTLADWITAPENPYFARTTANRLWGHLFGIGLIDPVDDEPTKENPPSHPELLKELSAQFVAHDFDIKYLIRAIVMSKTYQRSSKLTHDSQKEPRMFARAAVRGMTPEQLFDSLVVATGYQEAGNSNNIYFVNNNSVRGQFLTAFANTDAPTDTQTSILQALKLMNGKFINDATSIENSQTLTATAEAPFFNTEERLTVLYLSALSRLPRPDELQRLTKYVESGGADNDRKAALADVFWALLNSSEFMLNH